MTISAAPGRDPGSRWRAALAAFLRVAVGLWALRVAWLGVVALRHPGGMRSVRAESAWLLLAIGLGLLAWLGRSARPPASDVLREERAFRLESAAAPLLAVLAYGPALSLGWLSDDFVLRESARAGTLLAWAGGGFVRPFVLLLWRPFVDAPAALHALALLLHALNAALVAELARRLGCSRSAQATAALLFAAFPAAVEAVGWCAGIQDVVMTTAGLTFLIAWTVPSSAAAAGLALPALALALASKETAVSLPLVAAVLWWRHARVPGRRWLVWSASTAGAAALYLVLRAAAGALPSAAAPSLYLLKEILTRVFAGLALPWHPSFPPGAALAVAAAVGLPTLVVARAREWSQGRGAAGFALRASAAAFLAALPVWSFFQIDEQLRGSRYLYLPAVGGSLLLAGLLHDRADGRLPRAVAWGVTLALSLACTLGVRAHLGPWEEAAAERDRVLAAAIGAAGAAGCPAARFAALPDSTRGAYVFRNGFGEALLAASGGRVRADPQALPVCAFAWDGAAFSVRSAAQ